MNWADYENVLVVDLVDVELKNNECTTIREEKWDVRFLLSVDGEQVRYSFFQSRYGSDVVTRRHGVYEDGDGQEEGEKGEEEKS